MLYVNVYPVNPVPVSSRAGPILFIHLFIYLCFISDLTFLLYVLCHSLFLRLVPSLGRWSWWYCSAVGSRSIGFLAPPPPGFVRLPSVPSSVPLCLPVSSATVPFSLPPPLFFCVSVLCSFCFFDHSLAPFFFPYPFSCRPSCYSGCLSDFFAFSAPSISNPLSLWGGLRGSKLLP